jgi:hypothetical protein
MNRSITPIASLFSPKLRIAAGAVTSAVAVYDAPRKQRDSKFFDCSDYKCSHSIAISGDQWPDDVRLSDIEGRFVCKACGKRGADIRPDFHWDKPGLLTKGY